MLLSVLDIGAGTGAGVDAFCSVYNYDTAMFHITSAAGVIPKVVHSSRIS